MGLPGKLIKLRGAILSGYWACVLGDAVVGMEPIFCTR